MALVRETGGCGKLRVGGEGVIMSNQEQQEQLQRMSLEQLAAWAAERLPNSMARAMAETEFTRRQAAAQIEAAAYTKRNARYMLWSVIVLAISSVLSLIVAIAQSLR